MSQLNIEVIIDLLKEYTIKEKKPLEITLIGGLALHYYGMKDRSTIDVDGEVKGDVKGLIDFFTSKKIPSDLGENIAGWSVINMPAQYRERAITIHQDDLLAVKVLHPLDFVIAKLRRFTDEDIEDALYVVKKYTLKVNDINEAANNAINNTPVDTAIFIFKKNVNYFLEKLS